MNENEKCVNSSEFSAPSHGCSIIRAVLAAEPALHVGPGDQVRSADDAAGERAAFERPPERILAQRNAAEFAALHGLADIQNVLLLRNVAIILHLDPSLLSAVAEIQTQSTAEWCRGSPSCYDSERIGGDRHSGTRFSPFDWALALS